MTHWIAGVDYSLTCTGLVVVRSDAFVGGLRWDRIRTHAVAVPPDHNQVLRRAVIADQVRDWLRPYYPSVWIEQPITRGYSIVPLAMLGGVIIDRLGAAEWAPQSAARKLLLGSLRVPPGEHLKVLVRRAWGEPPDNRPWGYDVSDALCAANYGLHQLEYTAMVGQ